MVDDIGETGFRNRIDLEGEENLGDLVLKVACLFQGMMPTLY